MSFIPVPNLVADSIYDIFPSVFKSRGIELVLIDVDNTIAPYGCYEAEEKLLAWARGLKNAGIMLYILSNSRTTRPKIFAEALGIGYSDRSKKPFTKTIKSVLRAHDVPCEKAALIGDQVYTDVLCAKASGVFSVLVKPIKFTNEFLRLRFWLEAPFRQAYKWRRKK